jgi:hypothetical protein
VHVAEFLDSFWENLGANENSGQRPKMKLERNCDLVLFLWRFDALEIYVNDGKITIVTQLTFILDK